MKIFKFFKKCWKASAGYTVLFIMSHVYMFIGYFINVLILDLVFYIYVLLIFSNAYMVYSILEDIRELEE